MKNIPWFAAVTLLSVATVSPVAAETIDGFVAGADHVRIHYLQAGPADARRTLLLIPGWLTSASIWSKQLDYFSAHGYRIIAIDPRSQGGSSVVQTGNAPEDRAGDIQQVMTKLQLAHVILVGWSQGSQDVVAYVDKFGTGAVEGLALIDSPPSAGPDDVKASPVFVQAVLHNMASYSRDPQAYADGFMHAIISAPASAATFAQLDREFLRTPTDIGISMQIQDLFTADRRPALKKFDKPTLVVASGESPFLDAQKQTAAALPQGEFVSVDHAAHAVFFDQPQAFNRLLEAFVTGLDQPALLHRPPT